MPKPGETGPTPEHVKAVFETWQQGKLREYLERIQNE
jgi:hypothetical protein